MNKEQIEIFEIEEQMNDMSGKLDILASIADVLLESICFRNNLKPKDTENLVIVLQDKIVDTKKHFSNIVDFLNI